MNEPSSNKPAQAGSVILRPDIQRLSDQFVRLAGKAENRDQLILDFLQLSIGLINAAGAIFFLADDDGLVPAREMLSRQALSWSPNLAALLQESARSALSSGKVHYSRLEEYPAVHLLSCPTGDKDAHSGCLSFVVLTGEQPVESFLAIIQLLAALLSLLLEAGGPAAGIAADRFYQLSLVVARTLEYRNQQEALLQLNVQLRGWAGCDQVAIGTTTASGRMVLSSLSHVTSVDQRTEQSRMITKGLNECAIQQEILIHPATGNSSEHSSPVFQELLNSTAGKQAVGLALTSFEGKVVGAVIFFWAKEEEREDSITALTTGRNLLASCLIALQKKAGAGVADEIKNRAAGKTGRFGKPLLATAVVVLLLVLGLIPVPFRLNTDCLVQPVSTRFVVARFDGILQEVLVQSGDEVGAGDVLARLDGRETELTRASLIAERNKARKTRDHHLATGDTAAAQVARLDEQRLEQQLSLVQEKQKHLTLSSPIDGIVLTGDMKRIQGSPVGKGQTLFEVAPLKSMLVELAVSEDHIAYLQPDMEVRVRFDAYPNVAWQDTVQKINPKSQIRDNHNVFIAELEFDNPDGRLRPGMQGKAKIDAGLKPLGWILFRKPWYTLLRLKDFLF